MKGNYRAFFSFDVNVLRGIKKEADGSLLRSGELSFEEIGYWKYQLKQDSFCTPSDDKENESTVCQKRALPNLTNSDIDAKSGLDYKRISILEPVRNENCEVAAVCEVIESLDLNSSQNEGKAISSASSKDNGHYLSKLESCGNFDKSEEGATLRSEDSYYLVSMFGVQKHHSDEVLNSYDKALFSMGIVSTMNPYHVKSRSFRESIMLNYINERVNDYSKLNKCDIPYMLYQVNLSSVVKKDDAPKVNPHSFKTGYSFTLEINQGYKRIFMLKKLIGSGANASVFSADVCTTFNEKLVEIFSCAVKVQHKDLGLNIREIYSGLSLYKRNKRRIFERRSGRTEIEMEKQLTSNKSQTNNFNEILKMNSPVIQRTARSSISTTYIPGSNVPSSRNSINSLVAPADILEEGHANENVGCTNTLSNSAYSHRISFQLNSANTPKNNFRRSSVSSTKTNARASISSNYSCNYTEPPSEGNSLIEPIKIGNGVTVFCITELFVVSQSSSGMIQNILTREMMKGSLEQENKQKSELDDNPNASVGISILPTFFGSQSLQNILNEQYLKNGVTMEEPILLFLAYQFAETLLAFNEMNILHGDIKPDNILLYPNPNFDEDGYIDCATAAACHPLLPENHALPVFMSVIDFGRSLDIGEIYKNTFFEGNCHAKGFLPPVMLENLPWIHHIDIFGIASTIHCLITGKYMELTKWSDETLRCLEHMSTNSNQESSDILKVYNYRIRNQSLCLKRSWRMEFWSSFMTNCINFCPILRSKSLHSTCEFQVPMTYSHHAEPVSEWTKGLRVSQSIEEISKNVRTFLERVQTDIVSIFQGDSQLRISLYKQLLKIRKQLQGISAPN
ncbi:Bub1p related protein kinase [Cryptosporidium canis]|uniref:Bub1p related protein kinase n=1 Tax=Cryptosporidium canis TaxID=195482 RepID=A0ABQ8PC05_9CRYT|nr:Bub1p related protein kinase [Cryptosporidium canis]KAJ1615502.1 Bub1p related protein kinase [Cryptosporidium canis]